ncbi:hypothetical protein AVEN_92298-1 [Araneus ventricosus]|uniref:Tc1-like transposase DDE domain-containing protein n=1 Tax=Araneus ventricosus TaxID=182803 RepID=A0A4Y2AMD2_ARAVE|nr:hypothetical protein AVEN_92298-1 [Araneus ventricosus]
MQGRIPLRLYSGFWLSMEVTELSHPPYSPDQSPSNFFLFHKLRVALERRRCADITHIQAVVTRELKAIPVEEFSRAFDDLYTRCQR